MKNQKANTSAWRRILIVALLPLTILFWMVGWTFYWLGDQETLTPATKNQPTTTFQNEDWNRNRRRKESPQSMFT